MEIILAIVIIVVICKILGVSNFVLILCGLGIIELLIILMLLFFAFHALNLIFTKSKYAKFTRIDKPEKGKFKVAYYEIDGEEYPCVFPKESGFTSAYNEEKLCKVRYSKTLKKVYDVWAICTCIVGTTFSIMAVMITFSIIQNIGSIL